MSSRDTERAAAGALTLGRFAVSYLAEQGYGLEVLLDTGLIHAQAGWFWGKQVPIADDGSMEAFGPVELLFKGRHFDGQIIILWVSWYTSFKLSLRDLVIMMADGGSTLTHTTMLRWVEHYLPEFEKRADMLVRWVDPGGWTRPI